MNEPILVVDDEPRVLSAYQRNLGDRFHLVPAEGSTAALALLREQQFAVVLTDLKMPGMDGTSLLDFVRTAQPEAVRMMISGHANLADAIDAVNRGGIFRLLLKPTSPEMLVQALDAALAQHRLITAEKALLNQTLNGAITTLGDILAISDPAAFGQAQLRAGMARALAGALNLPAWELETAARLAPIGRATLPPTLNHKVERNLPLTPAERSLVEHLPEFSSRLLAHIPRLENVARIVLYQAKNFDGSGFPHDELCGDDIPLGARALRAIESLLAMHARRIPIDEAIAALRAGPEIYDPKVTRAIVVCTPVLQTAIPPPQHAQPVGPKQVPLAELAPGMVLLTDLNTRDGMLILGKDARLTGAQIQRIRNFAQLTPIAEPILVELPR